MEKLPVVILVQHREHNAADFRRLQISLSELFRGLG